MALIAVGISVLVSFVYRICRIYENISLIWKRTPGRTSDNIDLDDDTFSDSV